MNEQTLVSENSSAKESIGPYVDLQVNGYVGVDFNDPETTPVDLKKAALAMAEHGVTLALPTVITGDLERMCRCITNLRRTIEADAEVAAVFQGLHIEGPFISKQPGYIGAHPMQDALPQDLRALEKICDAGGPWTRLLTLAPEIDIQGRMTKFCDERGILVAAGHTDASLDQIDQCLEAGLQLFTHLGNGCPKQMDRHDNIIYRAVSRADRLKFSLIADGFHVPQLLFGLLLKWLPPENIAVVSDAISAAGLGPGTYKLGQRSVTIGPDRAARDPGGQHFVGSASTMADANRWLTDVMRMSATQRQQLLNSNPAHWLA